VWLDLAERFMESPVSLWRTHWGHEPGREKGPLTPTLPRPSPLRKRRGRSLASGLQFGPSMESPVSLRACIGTRNRVERTLKARKN